VIGQASFALESPSLFRSSLLSLSLCPSFGFVASRVMMRLDRDSDTLFLFVSDFA
jgi:hypothetical protein